MSHDTWRKEYSEVASTKPQPNDILRAYGDDSLAGLRIELVEGKEPFIYGRCYVPSIVGQAVGGWVLQSHDAKNNCGWKCVLLPKAREEVLRRFPNLPDSIVIKALRVVRESRSGNALLCEVAEWAEIQPEMVEVAA